jgi:hypothetical protein
MAQTTITITITTPTGVTVPQAINLVATKRNYDTRKLENETQADFIKRTIAEELKRDANMQRLIEAQQAVVLTGEVTAS